MTLLIILAIISNATTIPTKTTATTPSTTTTVSNNTETSKLTPAESLSIEENELIKTNSIYEETTQTTVTNTDAESTTQTSVPTTTVTSQTVMDNNCPVLKPSMNSISQDTLTSILTNSCNYDKLSKPPTDKGGPLPVHMQIDLTHIESADQLQFKAHMLVQYLYKDVRLKYDHVLPGRNSLVGEELLRTKIWVPHIMVRNEKDTKIMGIDGKDVFVSISPKGDVVYSYRMSATFYCWMNLQKFPFDSQDCFLRWNSWTYNTSNLILHWDEHDPVRIASNLHLTEFVLTGTWTEERHVEASFTKGAFVGNFSELVFKFKLSREVGYYVMDYFLPSILLVCTSWVTFWLQADASAPRVTLACACFIFCSMAGKPWANNGGTASTDFWKGKDQWLPTWHLETDSAAFKIDYVRVWAL